jgi:hypothetical protein
MGALKQRAILHGHKIAYVPEELHHASHPRKDRAAQARTWVPVARFARSFNSSVMIFAFAKITPSSDMDQGRQMD